MASDRPLDRHCALGVAFVKNRFSVGVGPQIVTETAELMADSLIADRIVDDRAHLAFGFQHPLSVQDPLNIGLTVYTSVNGFTDNLKGTLSTFSS